MRWLVDVGLWVVLVAFVLMAGDPMPEGSRLVASAYEGTTMAVLGIAVLVSRRLPLVAAALPCLFAIAVTGHLYSAQLLLSQIVLAYLLGRRTARGWAAVQLLVLVTVIGAADITANWRDTANEWFTLASNMMAQLVLPWAAGQYTRHYAELREAGWELAGRLEHEQDLAATQVRLRERARIAADMHDSLGHELSLIALRAGALQVSPAVGDVGHREASELREAAESATEQLHQIIGMLRDDTGPPVLPAGDTVAAIVRRAADSGVPVTLIDQTSGADLPEHVARAAHQVAQEALTNATRHAPGAKVSVTMRIEGEELTVEIASGAPPADPGERHRGGYGLVGLDERVRLAGGTLDARPSREGFTVIARLPLTLRGVSPAAVVPASYALAAAAHARLRRSLVGTLWPPIAMVVVLVLLYLLDSRTP